MIAKVVIDATAAIIMTFLLSSFILVFDFLLLVLSECKVVLTFFDIFVIVAAAVVVVFVDVLGFWVDGANRVIGS